MKLQILGSGAAEGTPAMFCRCHTCQQARISRGKDFRTRSCSLLDGKLLLDFSPDMFFNAARFDLELYDLQGIVFTHGHIDHCASESLCMKAKNYCDMPESSCLPVFGNETAIGEIKRALQYDLRRQPTCYSFHVLQAYTPVTVGAYTITPVPATHAPEEQAFVLIVEDGEKTYLHCMDTSFLKEQSMAFLKQYRFDAITMDCTYGDGRPYAAYHLGLEGDCTLKEQLIAQGSATQETIFTLSHIAHHTMSLHQELEVKAQSHGFRLGYDGMVVEI